MQLAASISGIPLIPDANLRPRPDEQTNGGARIKCERGLFRAVGLADRFIRARKAIRATEMERSRLARAIYQRNANNHQPTWIHEAREPNENESSRSPPRTREKFRSLSTLIRSVGLSANLFRASPLIFLLALRFLRPTLPPNALRSF